MALYSLGMFIIVGSLPHCYMLTVCLLYCTAVYVLQTLTVLCWLYCTAVYVLQTLTVLCWLYCTAVYVLQTLTVLCLLYCTAVYVLQTLTVLCLLYCTAVYVLQTLTILVNQAVSSATNGPVVLINVLCVPIKRTRCCVFKQVLAKKHDLF